ncbi:MAG: tetratricopeptide repeat protein [Planctomycetota bacterium]|nr:tetratricopeptide repeat protein [Planctomycetota bacterium]
MAKRRVLACAAACGLLLLAMSGCGGPEGPDTSFRELVIDYPRPGTVFPPDFTAPTFLWHDDHPHSVRWEISIEYVSGDRGGLLVVVPGDPPPPGEIDPDCLGPTNEVHEPTPYQASARSWTPSAETWADIKQHTVGGMAKVRIRGLDADEQVYTYGSEGTTTFTTSEDPVGAPIFYRDVPLMPSKGEAGRIKPLSRNAIPLIAWRLRDVGRPQSKVLLRSMPSCANCHSFSNDGKTLGMDVDGPDGDKGAYALVDLEERTTIRSEDVITWSSFEKKPKGHKTLGFLSQVSPDGRYAITTLNEELYVANFLDYRFLQVFYPTRGILAFHDRKTGRMEALPGADDPAYVHCDAVWTPDGKHLVYARARARDAYIPGRPLATRPNDPNETPIQYDLVRIPFNDGKGGKAVPIAGASVNGMSNTFPKVSPDGKWIVFVKCRNGQLMRPDGRLWILPLEGGEAREMTCNTERMNSWHTFSPNGRWMAFSSKANTPYTQLFLTHIDENGNDSPAILVPNSTAANRAVNIPEFLNAPYDSLQSIEVPAASHYLDLENGIEKLEAGDYDAALGFFQRALEKDPEFSRAHVNLGMILAERGKVDEAIRHYRRALAVNPRLPMAHVNLGFALSLKGKQDEAIARYREALRIDPDHVLAHNNLGYALLQEKDFKAALGHLERAVELDPQHRRARHNLALALTRTGSTAEAERQLLEIVKQAPDDIAAHAQLSRILLAHGNRAGSVKHLQRVVELNAKDHEAAKSLAWQLATAPEDDVRDGKRALALVRAAMQTAGKRTPALLDVLAAAHAAAGEFDEAMRVAQEALGLLGDGQREFAGRVRARLKLYERGKAYRVR